MRSLGGVGAYILKFVDVLGINQNKLIKKKEREREAASINSSRGVSRALHERPQKAEKHSRHDSFTHF